MKTAVMQPYFFPYLPYWQMLNAVDVFVILDDVNYIKRGYINSNSILINGQPQKFSISIEKPSQNKLISETSLFFPPEERERFLKTITMAYKKAPMFGSFFPILEKVILYNERDLTRFISNSFYVICDYLCITTKFILSSELDKNPLLKGEQKIIEINKCLGTETYINAIGGQTLYNIENFAKEGINLKFLKTIPCEYVQFKNTYVPNLSLIDVLMFNNKDSAKQLLLKYELIP